MDFNPKQNSKLKNHSILNERIYENFDGIHQEMLQVLFFPTRPTISVANGIQEFRKIDNKIRNGTCPLKKLYMRAYSFETDKNFVRKVVIIFKYNLTVALFFVQG